jgi:hypothetical protein
MHECECRRMTSVRGSDPDQSGKSVLKIFPSFEALSAIPKNDSSSIVTDGQKIEVQMRLLNVLAKTIAGPDTLRMTANEIDATMKDYGRRYAQVLAGRAR